MKFYALFLRLCAQKGVSASEAGMAIGGSRAMVSGWKSGKSLPTDTRIFKLAEYFGVPESEFYQCEDIRARREGQMPLYPIEEKESPVTTEQVKRFLFGTENVPDAMLAEVMWYARAVLRKEWDYKEL